jgi:Mce-associated membrane protein
VTKSRESPEKPPSRPGGDPTSIVQRPAAAVATEPDSVDNAGAGDDAIGDSQPPADDTAATGRFRLFLYVAAVVLVLAGAVLQVLGWRARHTGGTDRALVDAETTSVVVGDVSNGLSKIFSYAPDSTATTEQAATEVLGGRAASQYRTLFAQVKQRAAAENLTVTTHVVRAGVTRLSGNTAQLLVFLDQDIVRADQPNGTAVAAQLSVTARLDAGHWRIIDIHAR